MKVTEIFAPQYLNRRIIERTKRSSNNFEEFIINCKQFLKDEEKFEIKVDKEDKTIMKKEVKKPIYLRKMYKITSPANFRTDPNIVHGSFKYFSKIPAWARNNPRVVIEIEDIPIDKIVKEVEKIEKPKENDSIENKKDITLDISNKNNKLKKKCAKCEYETLSKKWLKKHIQKKHS